MLATPAKLQWTHSVSFSPPKHIEHIDVSWNYLVAKIGRPKLYVILFSVFLSIPYASKERLHPQIQLRFGDWTPVHILTNNSYIVVNMKLIINDPWGSPATLISVQPWRHSNLTSTWRMNRVDMLITPCRAALHDTCLRQERLSVIKLNDDLVMITGNHLVT